MKTYTVLVDGNEQFAFNATDSADALDKARDWGRYHSYDHGMISVRPATANERENWVHNEYIELTAY